ncbi:unnamed protein product [Rhizophagus irregularis]|uniref:Sacsin/Nov domain-containing protein n=1 Tax=Rhizophagus irregularis TaxID=588596 RepID=A0A915ZW41_9GLOM|nr:unnamed protein product [Rhizophagus irregularis]CAB5390539.1 unnamed protein product [Rhizophagus irregularis]
MSLDSVRNHILSNSSEGRVEVNQRDLIYKILARYSCKFVIFRELMQNSDDAESSSVKILFETDGNKITKIIFKNNGFIFRAEDWNRLVKIAEGNPDEQKIGAFGVGFYSVFSVTETPFVSSGGQGMAFYWRGNQLYTKQGPTDDDDKDWTTFFMDTREPLDIPNIEEFTRFLVNSLGSTENLQDVSLYIDDTLIAQLSKKVHKPKLIDIASGFNTFSPKKMFHLTSVDFRRVKLDVMRLLIPTKINIKQLRSNMYQKELSTIVFRIANGHLDVNVNDEFSTKMERVTKKKSPNKTSIQMIFTEFNELDSPIDYIKNLSPIYKDLISYPEQGKVYIGFPTNQTTGSCSHLAARVIPTMERELIDFAEPTLAEYNNEMLCLAGTLSRILYENEMVQMLHQYNGNISLDVEDNEETNRPKKRASKKKSLYKWLVKRFKSSNRTPIVQSAPPYREWLEKWAVYAISHFTYNTSTPNTQVSTIAETQFSNCLKQNMLILSTNGILPISDVRLPNPEMVEFIKTVPLVPENLLEQCNTFFTKAKDTKLIEELGFKDILVELKSRAFSENEIIKLLKWWISYLSKGNTFDTQLLKFARIGDSSQTLSAIKFYLNPDKIPLDISIPFEVLPYNISRNFTDHELKNSLKWTELSLVDWAKFIVNHPELESDPEFAEKVHHVLAKNLASISPQDKETIRQLFVKKRCIPTKFGMKAPKKTYFHGVDIFPSLPTIKFQNFTSSIQLLMEHFGVHKVIKLKLILERLVSQEDCDYIQVIQYLASVSDDLTESDMNKLKNNPIWPRENLLGTQSNGKIQRFVANDLHIPSRLYRELGLPIIDWKVGWSNNSIEGKFLISLGLQEYPKLDTILRLAAPPTNPEIRELALQYFIDKFDKYSVFYEPEKIDIAFLPCSNSNTYATPSKCFTNDKCMIMDFQIIRKDLIPEAKKLGVRQQPNREEFIKMLTENPPKTESKAKEVFEYLNAKKELFTDADWKTLNNSNIIPIRVESQHDVITDELFKPRDCFLKLKEESLNNFFPYVDFGTKANEFLAKCGAKEPSSADFAEISIDSSHELWNLYLDNYLEILRRIDPDLGTILNLITNPIYPEIREMSLKYFANCFHSKYSQHYKPEEIDIAFLPCSNSDYYARYWECFINEECEILGFKIIREDLRSKAKDFGVRQNPYHTNLLKRLTENPPKDDNKAKKIFEYLYTQKGSFTDSDWKKLEDFEFIPIQYEIRPDEFINKLIRPRDCFFELKDCLNNFFVSIDFGKKANDFLAKCGVKNEPSSQDFVNLLVNFSHELWHLYKDDVKEYLNILKKINDDLDEITPGKMNELDVLIANKLGLNSEEKNNYYLASAKEIYINDNKIYQQAFDPLLAPKKLEPLYMKLGSKSLHNSVLKSVIPTGPIQKTRYSQQLQKIINERASLFYLNHPKEVFKYNEKWLKKLKVREIEYMETSYKLGSITINEKNNITTNIFQESKNSCILYVTPNSNLIDVSQQIANHILTSFNSKDISYFNTVLSAPLSSLTNIGIFEPKLPKFSFLNNDEQSQDYDNEDINLIKSLKNKEPITITSENTQDLRNFLQDSIKSCYSNSGNIKSSNTKHNTKTCISESQVNYCDVMPGYSIHCVGNLQKIELYVPNEVDHSEILSQSRTAPLSQFINMIKDLADIFEITSKVIRIFYDDSVNSIAFNRDGALFFNLKFYLELHEQECKTKPTIDAMTYWFMIFCHILAHNFVQLHNSEFEYYSSSLAKTYMPIFLELMNKREISVKTFSTKTFWKSFNRFLTRN